MFPSTTAGHYWADKTTLRDLLPLTDKGSGATFGWRTQQYGNVIWTMKNAASTDGVTFNRDDVAVAARAIRHNADGSLDFLFAAAAANPITWVVQETLGPTGLLTIKAGAGLNFTTGAGVRIGTTDAFDVFIQRNGVDELVFLTGGAAKFTSPIAIGTNPAAAGAVRLANNATISWRNAANTTDISFRTDGGDNVGLIGAVQAFYSSTDNITALGSAVSRFTDLFLSSSVRIGTNPAVSGTIRVPTGAAAAYKMRNAANTADITLFEGNADRIYLMPGGGDIIWGRALIALGGGATPTFGTIGGSGPSTAAQNTWMQVFDSVGNAFWVPVWK